MYSIKEKLIISTLILLLLGAFLGLFYLAYLEDKEWQIFAQQHNCKITSKISGSTNIGTATGIMSNGKVGFGTVVTTSPDKVCYTCDDGVTYCR